jgi:fucose permease
MKELLNRVGLVLLCFIPGVIISTPIAYLIHLAETKSLWFLLPALICFVAVVVCGLYAMDEYRFRQIYKR